MSNPKPSSNSKVARVIEEYELAGMGEKLEAKWTGESGERTSLRDLADEFNREILRAAIRQTEKSATDSDVDSIYRVLMADQVSSGDTIRKERELKKEGVDIDRIRSDFVTHQAIHTYLTKHRGAVYSSNSQDQPERNIETIQRLKGRVQAVVESTINRMVTNNILSDREYQLLVSVTVVCTECGSNYSAVDLLRQGGCSCE